MHESLVTEQNGGAHPFLQTNVPQCCGFIAVFLVFGGGIRTCSWGIGTKALPDWYKHLIYNQCNVYKHLEVIIEMALIPFTEQHQQQEQHHHHHHFNCDFQVFAHIAWVKYKMFVSFKMCLGTDTPYEQVVLPPKNTQSHALKRLNGGR